MGCDLEHGMAFRVVIETMCVIESLQILHYLYLVCFVVHVSV